MQGFSESMLLLLRLADKRQMVRVYMYSVDIHTMENNMLILILLTYIQELTNPKSKQQLLSALEWLKITLPLFSSAMQAYVKSPTSISAKVSISVSNTYIVYVVINMYMVVC